MRNGGTGWTGVILAGVAVLAACSGGAGGQAEVPTARGVFKDAAVAGLSYVSGDQDGVTAADGGFTYEIGKEVRFFLGGLPLGSVAGQAVVTPLDLVTDGASDDLAVLNRVRFLLMLDDDDNPDNGLRISEAVQLSARTAASIWQPVDFSVPETSLAAELNLVIFDLNRIEGVQQLPTAAEARTHLEGTLHCLRSGVFRGTLTGGDSGRIGAVVDADTGELRGYAVRSGNPALVELDGTTPVSLDQEAYFISQDGGTGATFMGRLTDLDDITGSWEFSPAGQPAGTFLAERAGGAATAVYRFSAVYQGSVDAGVYAFDIDAAGTVTGVAYSVVDNATTAVTGALVASDTQLTASAGPVTITAAVDLADGTLSGGDTAGNTLAGGGCRLN